MSEFESEVADATTHILEEADKYDDTSFSLAERIQMAKSQEDRDSAMYEQGYIDAMRARIDKELEDSDLADEGYEVTVTEEYEEDDDDR